MLYFFKIRPAIFNNLKGLQILRVYDEKIHCNAFMFTITGRMQSIDDDFLAHLEQVKPSDDCDQELYAVTDKSVFVDVISPFDLSGLLGEESHTTLKKDKIMQSRIVWLQLVLMLIQLIQLNWVTVLFHFLTLLLCLYFRYKPFA